MEDLRAICGELAEVLGRHCGDLAGDAHVHLWAPEAYSERRPPGGSGNTGRAGDCDPRWFFPGDSFPGRAWTGCGLTPAWADQEVHQGARVRTHCREQRCGGDQRLFPGRWWAGLQHGTLTSV